MFVMPVKEKLKIQCNLTVYIMWARSFDRLDKNINLRFRYLQMGGVFSRLIFEIFASYIESYKRFVGHVIKFYDLIKSRFLIGINVSLIVRYLKVIENHLWI